MIHPAQRWADACAATGLVRHGMALLLRAKPGPVRDALLARMGDHVRVSAAMSADALDDGTDILASIAAGRPVERTGILSALRGRILVVTGAERLGLQVAARLADWIDRGNAAVVLIDEGGDGGVAPILASRAAMRVDLEELSLRDVTEPEIIARGAAIGDDDAIAALTQGALALGIASVRLPIAALRVARSAGEGVLDEAALSLAARLVLAPLATVDPGASSPPPDAAEPLADVVPQDIDARDMVVEAARATLPAMVLDQAAAGMGRGGGSARAKRGGGSARGRPGRLRSGAPGRGGRLDLAATVLAAAPFQRMRGVRDRAIVIRRDDLRVRMPRPVSRGLTIFAVDASGSSAVARLAEVKGAVEGLLATSYVRRDEVALIAFRGDGAQTLLPPTRSLARARRELAGLPGGGATPLAAGIIAGLEQAIRARGTGRVPRLLLLTDGGANVARDGTRARAAAEADALAAAALVRRSGIAATVVDTSRRGATGVRALAAAMGAAHVALPRLDEAALAQVAAGDRP